MRWHVVDRRASDANNPELLLQCHGEFPAIWVPGRHVVAVFEVGAARLLFADHDSPFEEALEICLLSRTDILDRVTLAFFGWASAGVVLERVAERAFAFEFPATRHWRLEVGARPAPVRPRLGVHRKGRWLSRLWLLRGGTGAESP